MFGFPSESTNKNNRLRFPQPVSLFINTFSKAALRILRGIVNGVFVENGDINGDGALTLIDVIRVFKELVK